MKNLTPDQMRRASQAIQSIVEETGADHACVAIVIELYQSSGGGCDVSLNVLSPLPNDQLRTLLDEAFKGIGHPSADITNLGAVT